MNPTAPLQSLAARVLLVVLGALSAFLRRDVWETAAEEPPERKPVPGVRTAPEPALGGWLAQLRASTEPDPIPAPPPMPRRPRRIAASVALVSIFCLGAALTAFAGDQAGGVMDDGASPAAATTAEAAPAETPTEAPTADATAHPAAEPPTAPPDGATTVPPADAAPTGDAAAPADQAGDAGSAVAADDADWAGGGHTAAGAPAGTSAPTVAPPATPAPAAHQAPAKQPHVRRHVVRRAPPLVKPLAVKPSRALEFETAQPRTATVWLHRVLPDPTPPSRRLNRAFAAELRSSAKAHGVDWALVLGVLRARDKTGSAPATREQLDTLAAALAQADSAREPWAAALAVTGDTATADSVAAIAKLDRALGLPTLVHGLDWAKARLGKRLLDDARVTIYPGGRGDIEAGRVDVRVLALIAYLAEEFGSIDVSCLESGHRRYARPGVVSAHVYGLAVDIASLGDTRILGNQEPGGITERAVRSILLLPAELRPRQVISLLGLGGPSFALADHADHIHVGY